jgi:peptidase E
MNANKLANELQARFTKADWKYVDICADMLRNQQAEIDALKKFKAGSDALDKKLHESMLKANEVWGKATKSVLKRHKSEG